MKAGFLRLAAFHALLYATAFVLNCFWETCQGLQPESSSRWFEAAVFVPMVARLALLDAMSVVGLQLCTALRAQGAAWRPSVGNIALFCALGAFAGWGVAYVAVVHLHLWAGGGGFFPPAATTLASLLQLPLTGLLGVAVARRLSGIGRCGSRRFS